MKKFLLPLIVLFMLPCTSINIPPPSFFISPDGIPNVLLVVGENASSEDVVSSSMVASRIGQMAMRAEAETYKKFQTVKESSYAFFPSSIVPNPYLDSAAGYNLSPLYFPPSPIPDPRRYNQIVLTPARLSTLFYFDENFVDYHGNDDGRFEYFETHEEIILRFYDAIYFHRLSGFYMQDNVADLYGGDFLGEFEGASPPTLISPASGIANTCPLTNLFFDWSTSTGMPPVAYQMQIDDNADFSSPIVDQSGLAESSHTHTGTLSPSTTYYWRVRAANAYGTSVWSATFSFTTAASCPAPGPSPPPFITLPPPLPIPPPPGRIHPSITYRVTPIYLPRYIIASSQSIDDEGTSQEFYAIPEPQIFLRGMMPKIYFFDKTYFVIDAGQAYKSVIKGEYDFTTSADYLVYGIPHYFFEEYIGMGETLYYENFAIRLDDVDLDHNKVMITITEPNLQGSTHTMVLNPKHGFSPSLQKEGSEGQPESENWTGQYLNDVIAFASADIVQEDEQFYTIAKPDVTGKNNIIVYFLLDGIATFRGKEYNGLMFNLYILDDWGRFYDRKCCFPYIDEPSDYALDIFRAGTITLPDSSSHEVWGMDVDSCHDMLNNCPVPFIIDGPLSYFNVAFEDVMFTEKDGDDLTFLVEKGLPIQTIYKTVHVKFPPQDIVRLDVEVTDEDKRNKNLILIGGPVSNSITKWLVENRKSRIDWYGSDGEWELIRNPFGVGNDVLVVAGRDRKTTRLATLELVRRLGQK